MLPQLSVHRSRPSRATRPSLLLRRFSHLSPKFAPGSITHCLVNANVTNTRALLACLYDWHCACNVCNRGEWLSLDRLTTLNASCGLPQSHLEKLTIAIALPGDPPPTIT